MDVDPNYDPSDFLKMPPRSREESQQHAPETMDYHPVNIKQEPQTHHQSYEDEQYDQSFDMSEMLTYQQPQPPVEKEEQHQAQQSQLLPDRENLDDVGIHDDLAISDSDEDDQNLIEPKLENTNNDNDNDDEGDGLWF